MAATVWKGQLEFGLVGCPVKMSKVHRDVEEAPDSHLAHKQCGTKIGRPWHCSKCKREVEWADLVKVFDDEDGNGATELTQDEFKEARIDEKKLVIESFVLKAELDPVYLSGAAYWIHLDSGKKNGNAGLFAWSALVQNMIDMGVVAMASWATRGKDHVVILRPYIGGKGRTLIAQVMEYGEVIETDCFDLQDVSATTEADLLAQLIQQQCDGFDASKYESDYAKKLRTVLAAKGTPAQADDDGAAPATSDGEEDDLIRKLRASLDEVAA